MATIRAYTTIEQSRKLAEILPIESADMYYMETSCNNYTIGVLQRLEKDMLLNKAEYYKMFPCWSLSALLELTPNDVSLLHLEDVYQAVYDVKPYYITSKFDNPLDATFEMICWLKESNKL